MHLAFSSHPRPPRRLHPPLRSWSPKAAGQASSIALVDAVLAALGDLLALLQAAAALYNAAACDQFLNRFLLLADAYAKFQSELITLKQSMPEVASATVEASEAIFMKCAAMSPELMPAVAQTSTKWLAKLSIRSAAKKAEPETLMTAMERLVKLEECIHVLETGSQPVFRRLLQSRVSLLNIHTPF